MKIDQMIKAIIFTLVCVTTLIADEETYKFEGKHYIANYMDCDSQAIRDIDGILESMDHAIALCDVTVLNKVHHAFQPEGLTVMYLLSESHASIHTYPESNACFIDLFTCGKGCPAKYFDEALRAYLKPRKIVMGHFIRNNQTISEIPISHHN